MVKVFLVVACLSAGGCYSLYDAVVDDSDPDTGGSLTVQIDKDPSFTAQALAKGDPLTISVSNQNVVVTCALGNDAAGASAKTTLATAGGAATLTISTTSRSSLSVYAGGHGCVCTTGEISMTSDANLKLTGTFSGNGAFNDTGVACSVNGTVTAIPQVL